jgi:signal transduction histidine kinase/DNA-binding response OmpR family regulator
VLVVDDVADARDLVSTILTMGGYEVVEAATGTEALRRLEDEPDIIVLDVHLPDMDGFEVCRLIKSNPRSATTPVVQISAIFSRTGDRVRGLAGGADAYLTKPFEPDLLVATVNALMRLRAVERQLSRSNRALRLQYELTRVLMEAAPAAELAARLLQTIAEEFGADVGELWRVEPADDAMVREAAWSAPGIAGPALDRVSTGLRLRHGVGIAGRSWVAGVPEWIDDLSGRMTPARAAAADALGLRTATVVPATATGGINGAVVLFHRSTTRPGEEALRLGSEVSARVGLFLERARNAEALQRAEGQLRQAQKMEAVGRLAGGIAHDFNNLLTVIGGHAQILVDDLPAGSDERREAEAIAAAADRAAGLTAGLLAFSRKQVVHPRVLDLTEVIRSMSELLRRILGENVAVTVQTAPGLGRVRADASQIEQVIMNLAVNALDAMPDGGRLTLALANAEIEASAPETLPPGGYVVLAVSDTGVGMDAATRARVFEPFFTTKPVGKGTGLGLSTVYGIVTHSGGDIWVESEPGKGTTFRIYLPRTEAASESAARVSAPALPRGTETLLLVEDEDAVRRLAASVLGKLGYTVLEAPDADEALELFAAHEGPLDLLVTDVVMPGWSGPRLADRLRALRSGLRVLYVSGYSDEGLDDETASTPNTGFLAKPYTGPVLARIVRELLDA